MLLRLSDTEIERFIEEDIPYGDLTTNLLGIGNELRTLVETVRGINPAIKISAAGGINENNAAEYAATGIDIIVLSSVYFGKPSDIGVSVQPV